LRSVGGMERAPQRIWRVLHANLATIVADLDAVLRAHLGGPALRLDEAEPGDALAAAAIRIGRSRIRLTLDREAGPQTGGLVLRVHGRGAAEIRIDPANDRWWAADEPHAAHPLGDRAALEAFLLSVLADAGRGDAHAQDPGPSSHFA
jgi:hypothetical protein